MLKFSQHRTNVKMPVGGIIKPNNDHENEWYYPTSGEVLEGFI